MSLPFTRSDFLEVFGAYNVAIWPVQVLATVAGVLAIALLFLRPGWGDRVIAAILAVFWAGMAIAYHWTFFSTINRAAYVFGALFLFAALLFFVEGTVRGRLRFVVATGIRAWAAAALVVYSVALYPLLGLLVTHPYPRTPLFGVAPCPTTIFTFAFLLLSRYPRPMILAAIPLVWSVIGGSAAVVLDVPQDYGLIAATLSWAAVHFTARK